MIEHTKTPWAIDEYYHPDYPPSIAIYEKKVIDNPFEPCSPVCMITPLEFKGEIDQANAEFILRACNNYDKAVKRLKEARRILDSVGDTLNTSIGDNTIEEIDNLLKDIGEL